MRKFKQRVVFLFVTAAMLAVSVAVSGPADATPSPYALCGGGSYRVIGSHGLGTVATIYLLYNGSTDCVVTLKKAPYAGTRSFTRALIQKQGSVDDVEDYSDNYAYYAGPVKVSARGICIIWGGEVNPGKDYFWASGWSHCG